MSEDNNTILKTETYWKNIKIQIAKNSTQNLNESFSKFHEIFQVASYISENEITQKIVENLFVDLFIPVARIVLSFQLEEPDNNFILYKMIQMCTNAACIYYLKTNNLKCMEYLTLVTDIKKTIYQSFQKKNQNKQGDDSAETSINNLNQENKKQNNPVIKKSAVPRAKLQVIEQQQQSNNINDRKQRKQENENKQENSNTKTGFKQFYASIAVIIIRYFTDIWKSFQNKTPQQIEKSILILKNISKAIQKQELRLIFQQIKNNVWNYFVNIDENNIRNVTSENNSLFLSHIGTIFQRIQDQAQKNKWNQTFLAQSSIPLIKCKLLKKKLIGLKSLARLSTEIYLGNTKFIKQKQHSNWLKEKKIFSEIFSLQNHEQVFQFSGDILKFMIRNGALQKEQFIEIFNIIEKAQFSVKKLILKILIDVSIRFGYKETQQILQSFQKFSPDILSQEMIQLMYDLSRYSTNSHNILCLQTYWKFIITDYQGYKTSIQEKLISRYIDMYRLCLDKSNLQNAQQLFDSYIQWFQQSKNLFALKLMRKILDQYPHSKLQTKYHLYKKLDYEIIQYLVQRHLLHEKILIQLNAQNNKYDDDLLVDFLSYIIRNFKQNCQSSTALSYEILLKITKFPKIFSQLLISYYSNYSEHLFDLMTSNQIISIQCFQCIKQTFYQLNKESMIVVVSYLEKYYEIHKVPKSLKRYQKLFETALNCKNQNIVQEIANFICSLYSYYIPQNQNQQFQFEIVVTEFIQQLVKLIVKSYQQHDNNKFLIYLIIMEEIMNQTEKKGVGNLVSHSSLVNTQSFKIVILNEITYGYDIIKKFQVKYPSNKTLFELLTYAGHQFKCTASEMLLKYKDREIKQKYNGFTIEQLNFRDVELVAHRRATQQIPKQNLIENDKLSQKAKKVFTDLFYQYSPSGKMTAIQLAKFVQGCTNDSCSVNDYRINQVYSRFDEDKDGILVLQNFLGFFEDSCKTRESTVWRNLQSLRYRNDLRKYQDIQVQIQYTKTARYILFKCEQAYEILFSMSKNENLTIRDKCIRLLKRLPTFTKIYSSIINEFEFSKQDEFSIWYKLTIIKCLLSKAAEAENQVKQDNGTELVQNGKKAEIINQKSQNIENQSSLQTSDNKKIDNDQKEQFMKVIGNDHNHNDNKPATTKIQKKQNEITVKDISQAIQFKNKFLKNKYYFKIIEEAVRISKQGINQMSNISRNCLSLSLQILRSLNSLPNLAKQLPTKFNIQFVELPDNNLQILIPRLYEYMIVQLFEPLLCLLLMKKQINLDLVLPGLFHKDLEVRTISNNFIYIYSKLNKSNFNIFSIKPQQNCKEFFNTIVKIMSEIDKLEYQSIFQTTFNEIKCYQNKEELNSNEPDYLFEGKLKVLHAIISLKPFTNLGVQFQKVILEKLHKTINQQVRSIMYMLLLRTPLQGVIEYINKFLQLIEPKKSQIFARNTYIGLYNLGCICYMNSIMQQFFMIPEFRNPILATKLTDQIPISEIKGKAFKDNFLYQLQKMFSFMLNSRRHEYNPETFCYSFKKDINLGVQQDAQQFLNMVFEKIETSLHQSYYKNLINHVFGGKTLVTIQCQNCKKPKYRIEEFNNLSLEVKGLKNIDDSLMKFIDKESISDYYCENCQTKVQFTTKQTHLNTLPNILIIHLQRIVFSYQTFQRQKIHSKLQFPAILDLKKYVKVREGEYLEEDEKFYSYTLKGIVIHSGNAQSGHYYSLIRQSDKWFRFDDSRVTRYNVSDIGQDAYGGQQQYNDWGHGDGVRSKNAYLLVYQKKLKNNLIIKNLTRQNLEELSLIGNDFTSKIQITEQKEQIVMQMNTFKQHISEQFQTLISKDNSILIHQLQFYHANFSGFIKNIINSINFPKEIIQDSKITTNSYYKDYLSIQQGNKILIKELIQLVFNIINILMKTQLPDASFIQQLGNHLNLGFFILPDVAICWFFNSDFQKLFEIIYNHPDQAVREFYRKIINRCFCIIIEFYKIDLNEESSVTNQLNEQNENNQLNNIKCKIFEYLNIIKAALYKQIPKNLMKCQQYFHFWKSFIFSSKTCLEYALKNQFIAIFIDFVLEKKSPILLSQNPRNYDLNNRLLQSAINQILAILQQLVINSSPVVERTDIDSSKHKLTQNQIKCLADITFYHRMIEYKQEWKHIASIITYQAEKNYKFSESVALILVQGINKSDAYQLAYIYIMIINSFMLIKDEFIRSRLEWIFGVPQYVPSGELQYSIKNMLANQNISYVSSLYVNKPDAYKSVLELLYIQRRAIDNFLIIGIKTLLNLMIENEIVLNYVLNLSAPNYQYQIYIDWIYDFLDTLKNESFITLLDSKDKTIEQISKQLEKVKNLIDSINVQSQMKALQIQDVKIPHNKKLIIGRNKDIQYADVLDIQNENYIITLKPIIHHTFVIQNKPTGKNNLSLPKQLFQDYSNYDKAPLKFFVHRENPIFLNDGELLPEFSPTILTLLIQNTVDITTKFTHQKFNYSLYLPAGQYKINTPYINEPLSDWIHITVETENKHVEVSVKKAQSTGNDYGNVGIGLIGGIFPVPYLTPYAGPIDSNQMQKKVCPDCTYLNIGLSYCQICGCNLNI